MKYTQKFTGLLLLFLVIMSCDTNNEVTGYDRANYDYELPQSFSITENATAATDNSFEVTYTPTAVGTGYYVVLPGGSSEPTSTQVHNASVSGILQSGNFEVDATTPISLTVDSDIYGGYDYDVYAIHKSSDDFISETVTMLSTTTIDTMDPEFLRDSSNPAFETGDNNPFGNVTLNFSEPVFYQGGDITFTGYFTGRTIVVNEPADITMSGLNQVITEHGTFAQDDFMIVSWDEGTFKDISGKSVAALSGFNYYFKTRLFTLAEQTYLMQGNYNYSTTFWGGLEGFYNGLFANPDLDFPASSGEYELVLDPEDADGLTLLGFNLFKGFASLGEPEYIKFKLSDDTQLAEMENRQPSAITAGEPTEWGHYSFFGMNFPGFWDLEAGTIEHWNTLYGVDSGSAIDDIDYIYTRINSTYDKNQNVSSQELKAKSAKRKQDILNGKTKQYKNAVLAY